MLERESVTSKISVLFKYDSKGMHIQHLHSFPVLTYNAFPVIKSICCLSPASYIHLVPRKVPAPRCVSLALALTIVMKGFACKDIIFLGGRGGVAEGCLRHQGKRRGLFVTSFFELTFMMSLLCEGLCITLAESSMDESVPDLVFQDLSV